MFLSSPRNPIASTNEPESLDIKRNNTSDHQSFEEHCLYSPDLVRRSSVRSSKSSKRDSRLAGLEPIEPKPQHHHHHHYLTQASNDSRTLSIATDISPKNNYSRRKRRPSTSSVTSTVSVSSAKSPAPTSSYFAPQPESSGFVARSPFAKRAPASRSSHGIETSSGPPPALSTQRSYTAEAARSSNCSAQQPPPRPRTEASSDVVKGNSIGLGTREPSECEDSTAASTQQKRVPVDQAMSTMDGTKVDAWAKDDGDATIRAVDSVGRGKHCMTSIEMLKLENKQAHTGNDDLFLRLARSNTTGQGAGDSVARSERRKVRTYTLAITH